MREAVGEGRYDLRQRPRILLAQPDRSFYVHSVPIAPPLQAILQDLRQRKSGNPFTDLLVSLLLILLTGFFTRLSELMERIRSGEYQPRPIAPRRQQPAPQPRQRTRRPGQHWAAETRSEPLEIPNEESPLPLRDGVGGAVALSPAKERPPANRPAPLPAVARTVRVHPPPPKPACCKPAPWHVHFVTI